MTITYTHFTSAILFAISFYINNHLYYKNGAKIHKTDTFSVILSVIIWFIPYINICCAFINILNSLIIEFHYDEINPNFIYNGIFKERMTKLIEKYNTFIQK